MSTILHIWEENDIVGQRDERFQLSRASRLLSHLVQASMTAPPLRPKEGYHRQETWIPGKKQGELTYARSSYC